ncbi:bis(5'-nucleosyl)-tetraphosphatase (symmetrical) YqeK [Bacillus sp. S/N-304-OC-R1]|uniref:bis(5'-nucleosyl)-tetraphosphatase (symmetrical) YqeK n=1 Tax=Bacillus sp. S/N-304-OC-R1 TaxID=2758034 RepID=UPI001C8DCF86|nr:bis(5'-nucleosyl)-tetraphosphatase (symmetrical) YqeK [Bacillus sp. S/N-304-OC-R1]MBY0123863.1 bis(5'-nucleosyl)-tetraphosphatase (symmetrical) YqeK [Bacillus sp. S/N-304-OC-R1]
MDRDVALKIVKEQLTDHRYQHTIGVMDTAISLAEKYGADSKKAEMAAIFHDYAKFRPKEEMKKIIVEQGMPSELLLYNSELWHAPVGAFLVQKEVGIEDVEILDAIRFHTSGRINMTLLEKVIYLADYIEPGRHFPGVDEVREMAQKSLNKALIKSIQNTILFLMKKGQPVFPDTFNTYNDLIMRSGGLIE